MNLLPASFTGGGFFPLPPYWFDWLIVAGLAAAAWLAAFLLRDKIGDDPRSLLLKQIRRHDFPLMTWLLLLAAGAMCRAFAVPAPLLSIFFILLSFWLLLDWFYRWKRKSFWAGTAAGAAYAFSLAYVVYWVHIRIVPVLDAGIHVAGTRLTVFGLIKGALVFGLALWAGIGLSHFAERSLGKSARFSPGIKVLIAKIIKFTLILCAFLFAVDFMGMDLTLLAVFGGGIGLGIGFGLQKVISNLVSGLILLTDRSIKPGDVIEIEDTYGWINHLSARYVSIITRDGTEHLIPNEDLITQRVVNWSFTDNNVRLKVPIGVSYNSDVRLARELILKAAGSIPRVLPQPAPVCPLTGFGESSVDFELRFWINDPANGVANVKSEILFQIWDLFHARGIEIPFPQRDLHIKSAAAPRDAAREKEPPASASPR